MNTVEQNAGEKVAQKQQCPGWIQAQHINITEYTLYPAEPQGHQKHLAGFERWSLPGQRGK